MAALAAATLVAFVLGGLLVLLLWPVRSFARGSMVLRLSLAGGLGLGIEGGVKDFSSDEDPARRASAQ